MLPTNICQHILIFVDLEEYHRICKILHIPLCFNQYFKYHELPNLYFVSRYTIEPVELVNWLLSKDKYEDNIIEEAIYAFIYYGHINIVTDLVSNYGGRFSELFKNNMDLIDYAAECGDINIIQILRKVGIEYSPNVLGDAITGNHFETVKYLVSENIEITNLDINNAKDMIRSRYRYLKPEIILKSVDNIEDNIDEYTESIKIYRFLMENKK